MGTGSYASAKLSGIPAVVGTLADLGQALVERCGLPQESVRIVMDPAGAADMGVALAEESERAEGVLFVYYVGHGLVSPGGELYLATRSTDPRSNRLAHTALAYAAVRDCLLDSPAQAIVVILDCCFSGRALGVLGEPEEETAAFAHIQGGFVLTSAAREQMAMAPLGARHTAFSGELLRLLTEGDPQGSAELTLRQVYRYLDRELSARSFPRPRRQSSANVDDLVLAPNAAYRTSTPLPLPVGVDTGSVSDTADVCPYPGLAAFEMNEASWFFGRERLTAQLVTRLAEDIGGSGPLMVSGPSGSGKSSLLRAGLLPALARGSLPVPGSRTWPRLVFTPTAHPMSELATKLAKLTAADYAGILDRLHAGTGRPPDVVRDTLQAMAGGGQTAGARLVLVVDQFEETFTLCADDSERRAFIHALCAAARGGDARTEPAALVVLGMRADFYGHCAAFPELVPALQDGQVLVGAMTIPELRAAITRPAEATGQLVQEGLVELLLRDLGTANGPGEDDHHDDARTAGYDPGALPLLSHALRVTWQQREGRTLTLAGYQHTGGIRQAIATTAERTYQRLDDTGQGEARQLLLRLVHLGDGGEDTRRRLSKARLIQEAADPAMTVGVLDSFTHARLLTINADIVEITHEALLRAWPRLRGWIDTDRAGLLVHQQLADAAATWDSEGRDPSALYRGTRLAVARAWAGDPGHLPDITPLTRDFLQASSDEEDETKRRQDQARQREKRIGRRLRQLVAGLAVLLILAIAATAYAVDERGSAFSERNKAIANEVAIEANVLRSGDPSLAMQLSLVAYHLARTAQTHSSLLSAFAAPYDTRILAHTSSVNSVAFSPDGRTLATGSGNFLGSDKNAEHTARLWNIASSGKPKLLATLNGHTNAVTSVAFSRSGRILITGSSDGTIRPWRMDTTQVAQRVCATAGSPITQTEWKRYVPTLPYRPPC
jgi:Novel STAND NTPase 1/WD domain, G-beta repeat/Caspase domain